MTASTITRRATNADLPALVDLGRLMHAESPRFRRYDYLPERVIDSIKSIMGMSNGFAMVAERGGVLVGGLLAVAVPHYACDFWQASDLALFVHPQERGGVAAMRLVSEYRAWAAGMGAEASIGINTGVEVERTQRLLRALGAQQTGTIWTWEAM